MQNLLLKQAHVALIQIEAAYRSRNQWFQKNTQPKNKNRTGRRFKVDPDE